MLRAEGGIVGGNSIGEEGTEDEEGVEAGYWRCMAGESQGEEISGLSFIQQNKQNESHTTLRRPKVKETHQLSSLSLWRWNLWQDLGQVLWRRSSISQLDLIYTIDHLLEISDSSVRMSIS
jgi:hypothetical protein